MSKSYLLGAWSGFAFLILLLVGMLTAGFIPAHIPSATAQEVATLYQENTVAIRIGAVLIMLGSAFYFPWVVTLSELISKMEIKSTFYNRCQLVSGSICMLFFFLPGLFFAICAFRPERAPELTQLMNDIAWLFLITPIPPFLIQYMSLALATFKDKEQKVLPRWYGYFTIWTTVLFLPGFIPYFIKTGPFAWNGFFAFWVPLTIFGVWILVTIWLAIKAINKLANESNQAT